MVSAFEGYKAETKTMLPVIEVFMAAHGLPDVTVRPQPQPDSSRSRNIEANPATSSFNGGQGVLPVLAVEGALGSHATGGLSTRSRLRRTGSPRSQCWMATGRSTARLFCRWPSWIRC
jgi:hypothetical protein